MGLRCGLGVGFVGCDSGGSSTVISWSVVGGGGSVGVALMAARRVYAWCGVVVGGLRRGFEGLVLGGLEGEGGGWRGRGGGAGAGEGRRRDGCVCGRGIEVCGLRCGLSLTALVRVWSVGSRGVEGQLRSMGIFLGCSRKLCVQGWRDRKPFKEPSSYMRRSDSQAIELESSTLRKCLLLLPELVTFSSRRPLLHSAPSP